MSSVQASSNEVVKPKGVWRPGKQPGAGRKKGSVSKRTKMLRLVAENAVKKGKSPLDIMLKNMRFYDDKAQALMSALETKLADKKFVPAEVLALLQEMSGYRMNAQKCATDAAPFVHPKLTSIAFKDETPKMTAKPESDMSSDELSDYYNNLRLRPTAVQPLIIDNETGDPVPTAEADED